MNLTPLYVVADGMGVHVGRYRTRAKADRVCATLNTHWPEEGTTFFSVIVVEDTR
jgi:hypothetical protein